MFLFHWKEESQHAILDELEWRREHERLSAKQRDQAVTDLIALVAAADGILRVQAAADAEYFVMACDATLSASERRQVKTQLLRAYRWQYIVSGIQNQHFARVLEDLTTGEQRQRIETALDPILNAT